jgi:hypothetical protein
MRLSGSALTGMLAALAALLASALPRREGHQLGGGLPGPDGDPLARRDPAEHGLQRHLRPRGPAPDLRGGGGRPRRRGRHLRAPNIYNLRADPFERGPESLEYGKWMMDRAFLIVPSQAIVGQWLSSFKEFPIRQKPASFNLDSVMEKLSPHH